MDYQGLETIPNHDDIKRAVFSFKPTKAPGPDGIHPLFYQKYWDILGNFVEKFCENIFTTCTMDEKVNTTYRCLIPKCNNATNLRNFRPIGLCITQYKIITKIITDRMKHHLNNIISPTQLRFLTNRRASDNAIIVQEYITYFSKMKGKKSNMILKINLEKAFDRIEWSFVRQALHFFNFPPNLIKLIMSCISTSSISIFINGGKTEYFKPTREIR